MRTPSAFEPRPATRAEMTFARTPRVQARALHSDNGGASLMLRRQPDHILDNVSATFRWPSGVCANSPADIDCTWRRFPKGSHRGGAESPSRTERKPPECEASARVADTASKSKDTSGTMSKQTTEIEDAWNARPPTRVGK